MTERRDSSKIRKKKGKVGAEKSVGKPGAGQKRKKPLLVGGMKDKINTGTQEDGSDREFSTK